MLESQKHYKTIENRKVKLFLFYICEKQAHFKFFCLLPLNIIKYYLEGGFYSFDTIIGIQYGVICQ